MLSVEATGKNIEQAIDNALFELKATRDDVDIKILEEGGFFKKAKVEVSISADALYKYEKVQKIKEEEQNQSTQESKLNNSTETEQEVEELVKEEDETEKKDEKEEETEAIDSNLPQDEVPDVEKAKNFVQGLLEKSGLKSTVEATETEEEVLINILGGEDVIGYRGDGLNALQYLTSVYVGKNNRHSKRIRIDCDNYRGKREETLVSLAKRMAQKVRKTHHFVKLEPMTANERRIIHSTLADEQDIETFSKGEEPHRFLIIRLRDGEQSNTEEI